MMTHSRRSRCSACRPEGVNLWIKALALDGSDAARKRVMAALQGIQKARPPAAAWGLGDSGPSQTFH